MKVKPTERVMPLDSKQTTWMRVPEAARYFRIPRSRMYELIHSGDLPAVRIGERSIRINREEAERFLTENRRVVSNATDRWARRNSIG